MRQRAETGGLKFAGDPAGVFIRGDAALAMASSLEKLAENAAKGNLPSRIDILVVESMVDLLKSAEKPGVREAELLPLPDWSDAIGQLSMLGEWVRRGEGYERDDARDEIARAIENRVRSLRRMREK